MHKMQSDKMKTKQIIFNNIPPDNGKFYIEHDIAGKPKLMTYRRRPLITKNGQSVNAYCGSRYEYFKPNDIVLVEV